ncbi:MAG: hypothetical protein Q7U34_05995, partial [Anaerolineales bacterium]|nr:hypothetical protein [Anaerolineales bacterium]
TATAQYNANQPHLYSALELGNTQWKLGFTIGFGQRPRLRPIILELGGKNAGGHYYLPLYMHEQIHTLVK